MINGPDREHTPRHVLRFGHSEGLRVEHTVHRGRQETRLSRKDSPATHSVPDPGVGNSWITRLRSRFIVRSGYKWTARTTELHPDGECKHRPPKGETPGEGTRADDNDPPPPTTAGKARARHGGNTAPSDAAKK